MLILDHVGFFNGAPVATCQCEKKLPDLHRLLQLRAPAIALRDWQPLAQQQAVAQPCVGDYLVATIGSVGGKWWDHLSNIDVHTDVHIDVHIKWRQRTHHPVILLFTLLKIKDIERERGRWPPRRVPPQSPSPTTCECPTLQRKMAQASNTQLRFSKPLATQVTKHTPVD